MFIYHFIFIGLVFQYLNSYLFIIRNSFFNIRLFRNALAVILLLKNKMPLFAILLSSYLLKSRSF